MVPSPAQFIMEEMEFAGVCESCGKVLIFKQTKDEQFITHDLCCEKPTLSMLCNNPRRLGVVTGVE